MAPRSPRVPSGHGPHRRRRHSSALHQTLKERHMDRHQREHWLLAHGFHNVDAIVGAVEEQDRPTIQRACAMLLNETAGGANIYGSEGSTPELYEHAVTEQNYRDIYLPRRAHEGPNGVGPCQLTTPSEQDKADAIGGCWNA